MYIYVHIPYIYYISRISPQQNDTGGGKNPQGSSQGHQMHPLNTLGHVLDTLSCVPMFWNSLRTPVYEFLGSISEAFWKDSALLWVTFSA